MPSLRKQTAWNSWQQWKTICPSLSAGNLILLRFCQNTPMKNSGPRGVCRFESEQWRVRALMLAASHTPCRLLGTAPAPRLINSFFVLLNFHAAGGFELYCQVAGRFPPHLCSPMPALPAGPSCPRSPPVSCCYSWDTDKLLVLLSLCQGWACSGCLLPRDSQHPQPGLHTWAPDSHCCSRCSSVPPGATMPCAHLRGSRQLSAASSCFFPDAAGDLSEDQPLGWKNPRPGSCKASSKPQIADQIGTSFPWLQQERGARGFAANPGPSASWCPQGWREEDGPTPLQDAHFEGTGEKSEISVTSPFDFILQPPSVFAAPACLYPVQVLAVAAEAETWFVFSSLRCVPHFPQRKRRGAKKSHIFAADCDWLM